MDIHIVSKVDNRTHAVITLEDTALQVHGVAPSSVRVRPVILSLTPINLSYARGGK